MTPKSLETLFHDQLKDIYYAEKKILKALPKMAKGTRTPELAAAFDASTRREFQLAGGDDYELCFTAPDAAASDLLRELADSGCAATCIGHIVAGANVGVHDASGNPVSVPRRGWEHFA